MRVNKRMAALLAASQGAAIVDVPEKFRWLLAAGVREVDGCVFLRELFTADDASALPSFHDAVGFECSINKVHLEDFLDRGYAREPAALALIALSSARLLATTLHRVSNATFRIIASVQGRHSTLRFHKVREGESWLAEDLDGYAEEAIFVLDTDDPSVTKRKETET